MKRCSWRVGCLLLAAAPQTNESLVVGNIGPMDVSVLSLEADPGTGTFWGVDAGGDLFRIDRASGTSVFLGSTGFPGVEDLTLDPDLGILYGVHSGVLLAIDPINAATFPIGSMGSTDIRALAFDRTKRDLYAVESLGSYYAETFLLDVDEMTGAATTIGLLSGLAYAEVDAMAFDESSGALYGWANGYEPEGLLLIDPDSATSAFIGAGPVTHGSSSLTFDVGALYGATGANLLSIDTTTGTAGLLPAPGADFGDLQVAIDAANVGDILLLVPGGYGSFTLDKGLRILGDALDPAVVASGTVAGIPVGETAVLSGMDLGGAGVSGCDGVVALESVALSSFSVVDSPDVRLHGARVVRGSRSSSSCSGYGGLRGFDALFVRNSRLELVGSELTGGAGACCPDPWWQPGLDSWGPTEICAEGGVGINLDDSFLHLALSDASGGRIRQGWGWQNAGIDVDAGSEAIVAGTQGDVVSARLWDGTLRHSGVTISTGGWGTIWAVLDPDPTLETPEPVFPGSPLVFNAHGTPGAGLRLFIGTTPAMWTTSGSLVEQLLVPLVEHDLGVLGPSGEVSVTVTLPPWWPEGEPLFAQVEATHPDGQFHRSNSALLSETRPTALLLAAATLRNVRDTTLSLPRTSVTTPGNQQALASFITQAADHVEKGNFDLAVTSLQRALERTDGCSLRGAPDPRSSGSGPVSDYVLSCSDQARVAPVLQTALETTIAAQPPVAGFSASPISGVAPLDVTFTNRSSPIGSTYLWDFGDGTTSTLQNPLHTYSPAGIHTVSLTVTRLGGVDTETKTAYIGVVNPPPPVAEFSGGPTIGSLPLHATFTDLSTGNVGSHFWDFGDGGTSTAQNPSHAYWALGKYTVRLSVTGLGGTDTVTKKNYITVAAAPVSRFSGTPTFGVAPLQVDFSDLSTGLITSWSWKFGDGNTSTLQNPSHSYTRGGSFKVSLTVAGPGGAHTTSKSNYIDVTEVTVDFSGTPTSGSAPLQVSFTDLTVGATPLAWWWDFGDGKFSSLQNPVHTYSDPGAYTVSLMVSGPFGYGVETRAGYITVF